MHELKKILVATDLEDVSDASVQTAVLLARAFDARILLLHVVPDTMSDSWTEAVSPELVTALLDEVKIRIEAEGPTVEDATILTGKPSYRICQHAEAKDVNLLVIGASRKRARNVRLGVTAGRVLRNSVKPVFLMAHTEAAPPTAILCPVDDSPAARRALQNAIALARKFAAQLTVLRVREGMPEVYARIVKPGDHTGAREVRKLRSGLNALVREFDIAGVALSTQVREGVAYAEILSVVSELGCDLVVMGVEGMNNHSRALVGSVTQKVTREMPCSMLIVSEEDILTARLNRAVDNIQRRMQEGETLLKAGYALEALAEYEQCLLDEPTYARAWDGMADAFEALGDLYKADRCRESAHRIRDKLG